MTVSEFAEVTKAESEKSLVEPMKKTGGRNNKGRITTRHRGGGHKRRYRVIDFKRTKDGVPAKVAAIEYDPNRSANIALLHYADGAKAYILAPARLRVGSTVESGPAADIKPGNALPLANIPTGTLIHNVELKLARAARSRAAPAPGSSSSERTRATESFGYPPGSFGECCSPAAPRWGRSATSTTRTSPRARQDAPGGVESAPRCAARP